MDIRVHNSRRQSEIAASNMKAKKRGSTEISRTVKLAMSTFNTKIRPSCQLLIFAISEVVPLSSADTIP
jgi:hypothetical protein